MIRHAGKTGPAQKFILIRFAWEDDMKTLKFNAAGGPIEISAIVCGTAEIGGNVGKRDSFAILDYYLEQGGTLIDTAKVYGSWHIPDRPLSEEMIGQWMQARGNRRRVVISTKGAHPLWSDMDTPRVTPGTIAGDIEDSLFALGTDYIDIYWLHRDDVTQSVGPIMEALNRAIREGKIRAIGASNWSVARVGEANAYAAAHGLQGFAGTQVMWSAAKFVEPLNFDDTLVQMSPADYAWYRQEGIAIFAFSSQARGVFVKAPAAGGLSRLSEEYRRYFSNTIIDGQIAYAHKLAEKYRTTPSSILLAYINSHDAASVALAGFSSLAQAKDSLDNTDIALTPEELGRLGWMELQE